MFWNLVKGLQWQLGPMSLLLLLLIIGRINTSVAAKSSSNEVNANAASDDYGSEDDETAAPAEQNQPKGPKPFFEEPTRTIYVKPDNKTQINCPVQNFDDVKHSILWYKDNKIIANGNHSMANGFHVDAKMNLVIEEVTNDSSGNYTCKVIPANVNQTTSVKVGEEPQSKDNGGGQLNIPGETFIAICFIYFAQLLVF